MKKPEIYFFLFFLILYLILCNLALAKSFNSLKSNSTKTELFFIGKIINTHKEPVEEADVKIFVNKKLCAQGLTSGHGTYQISCVTESKNIGSVEIEIEKASYRKLCYSVNPREFAHLDSRYFMEKDFILKHKIGPAFWIATIIFLVVYVLISFELLHRTIAALLGASILLIISYTIGIFDPAYHIISFERAIEAIDMNVILLLMGMMIVVGVLKYTGVFQWCAYISYRLARGNVFLLTAISCVFIAVTSAFLDNVTTMLLYTPVLIEISLALNINPFALLLPGIMASNIGGTSTLIGDPPNIIIGSYSGLTFMEFVKNLTPPVILSLLFLIIYNKFFFGKEYKKGKVEDVESFIERLKEKYKIKDPGLLKFGLFIMGVVIFFFITHGYWHMEASIPALFGGAFLFTYAVATKKVNILELIEKDIEWSTLLFFMFLFILVGAVEEVGLLDLIADWVHKFSHGSLFISICLIIWVSAIMSAFVDNIPFTATMLPIVEFLSKVTPGAETHVLWWALALGACFGGNGTLIGASANVVTVGIAESVGYRITFLEFFKFAFLYMIISVVIANIWLLIFY
jgi:Na+/H+ antiporter NhaD/arsenite permease-like protein